MMVREQADPRVLAGPHVPGAVQSAVLLDETQDLPDDREREAIWRIHLNLRKQDVKTINLTHVVSASDGFSGSEIEQAVVAALYRALHQKTALTTELLIEELTQTVPLSVTRREDIDHLRETAQGRFVSVR